MTTVCPDCRLLTAAWSSAAVPTQTTPGPGAGGAPSEGASSGALSSRRDSSSSKRSTEGLGRTIAPSRGDRPGCREKNGVCAQGGESPRRSRTGLSDGQEPERMSQQPFSGGARAQAPKGYRADASRIQYG